MDERLTTAEPSHPLRTSLEQPGFTPEQIERLVALRDAYPFIEFVDSAEEWQRLLFLKWRYTHQQVPA